jgi:hypothetical protein
VLPHAFVLKLVFNVNVEERLKELEAKKKYLCIVMSSDWTCKNLLNLQQKLFIESLVYGLELLFFPAFSPLKLFL